MAARLSDKLIFFSHFVVETSFVAGISHTTCSTWSENKRKVRQKRFVSIRDYEGEAGANGKGPSSWKKHKRKDLWHNVNVKRTIKCGKINVHNFELTITIAVALFFYRACVSCTHVPGLVSGKATFVRETVENKRPTNMKALHACCSTIVNHEMR